MYIREQTLDDLLRQVISRLLTSKTRIAPTRGGATELSGVLLELTNPRARLSRTEAKGRLFSCLGELWWYLAKTDKVSFIAYYVPQYRRESEDGRTVYGAYGPRLFKMRGRLDQIANVLDLLKRHPNSRRAVIQLFDAADLAPRHKEIPCTCTLQFMVRHNRLLMLTSMRSNDAFVGLPHDVFAFTMLQELLARTLSIEVGEYKHAVGSLHLYDHDKHRATQYLSEGWQSTTMPMPPMPLGDPWPSIRKLLKAEKAIRHRQTTDLRKLRVDPYWKDLIRLLRIYRHFKDRDSREIARIKRAMSVDIYDLFIEDKEQVADTPEATADHLRRARNSVTLDPSATGN